MTIARSVKTVLYMVLVVCTAVGLLYLPFFYRTGSVHAGNACTTTGAGGDWNSAATWTNCGGTTPQSDDDVTILTGDTVTMSDTTAYTVNSLTVESGGTLTHDDQTDTSSSGGWTLSSKIDITAGSITIEGDVDVEGNGYQGGSGGFNSGSGRGPGAGQPSTEGHPGGAGHAGAGGCGTKQDNASCKSSVGATYGSTSTPDVDGNAGSSGFYGNLGSMIPGDGGGYVKFTVTGGGTFSLTGTINANATDGYNVGNQINSGGSGGFVWVDFNNEGGTMSGSGTITVEGGNGSTNPWNSDPGGGGGGYIILTGYSTDSSTYTTSVAGGTNSSGSFSVSDGSDGILYTEIFVPPGTWTGDGVDDDWCTADNWQQDSVPTSSQDVYIDETVTVTTAGCGAGGVEFGTLTIGETSAATLQLGDVVGTAGSITIKGNGTIEQNTSSTLSFTGNLTMESGATLTHADNSTSHLYSVNMSFGGDIDIQNGATVTADGLGYNGGTASSNGNAPAGTNGYGRGSSLGGGGAHAGDGGDGFNGAGGTAYCNITNPSTMGAGGGGAGGALGGDGGGYIKLLASSGTLTVNGTITADGENGNTGSYASGGGAGGAIVLGATSISGTPTSFTVSGGNNATGAGYYSGAGGGGCAVIGYVTSNSITDSSVTFNGGTGASHGESGGSGLLLIQQNASGGTVYAENSASSLVSRITADILLDAFSIASGGIIQINTGVTVTSSAMLGSGGTLDVVGTLNYPSNTIASSTINLKSGGNLYNQSTLYILSDGGLQLSAGTVNTAITAITSSGTLWLDNDALYELTDLTVKAGTTTLYSYTTSSPLVLDDLIINGGVLTHAANTSAQSHVLSINANTIDLNSGGAINVSERGYAGTAGNGNAPAGTNGYGRGASLGGGGAHAGDGGDGYNGAGGTAYCTTSNPDTMGAGGGGASGFTGGNGGGLIYISVTSTFSIDGAIYADGADGVPGSYATGGGGGGGVNIYAGTLSGTPSAFSAVGGAGATGAGFYSGAGGGGCVYILYETLTMTTSSITVVGGDALNGNPSYDGADGTLSLASTNSAPTVSFSAIPSQTGPIIFVTGTVADADLQETSVYFEYSLDGTVWNDATIVSFYDYDASAASGDVPTSTISGITTDSDGSVQFLAYWMPAQDGIDGVYDTSVYVRMTPNDGMSNGSAVSSSAFTLDTADPTVPGSLVPVEVTTSSMLLQFPSVTSSDPTGVGYQLYYATGTPAFNHPNATLITSAGEPNLADASFNGATSTLISGLIPNTTYYASLRAIDAFGNTTSSLDVSTTTLAEIPTGLTYVSYATSSITAIWNTGGTNNPSTTVYEVYNFTDDVFVGNTTNTNFGLTGLTPGQQYSVGVRAQNSAGVYTAYSVTPFVTFPVAPDAPSAVATGTSTVTFSFGTPNNGNTTTYAIYNVTDDVYVDATGSSSSVAVYQASSTWGATISITDLRPNTSYTFQTIANVLNSNFATSSASTQVITYTTAPSISFSNKTTSTVAVTLTSNDPAGAIPVLLSQLTNVTTDTVTTSPLGVFELSGLTPNTTYQFIGRNYNAGFVLSASSTTGTLVTYAVPPAYVTTTAVSATEVALSWPDSGATQYKVYQNGSLISSVAITSTTATDLTCETSYTFGVFGHNALDEASLTSTTVNVITGDCPVDEEEDSEGSSGGGGGSTFIRIFEMKNSTPQIGIDSIDSDTGSSSDVTTEVSCQLPTESAVKSSASNAVYYITSGCTKRAFSSSPKYFTYFTSWDDYTTTLPATLNSIPDDTLGFMPWGPLYNPASGALIKTPSDPKTYLLLDGTLYHIADEVSAAFQFGPAWATWIEDVDAGLLENYPLSTTKLDTTTRPDGILIKYQDEPEVYQLDTENNEQVKRWIPDTETFRSLNFRDDRIVTIPSTETYPDGTDLAL